MQHSYAAMRNVHASREFRPGRFIVPGQITGCVAAAAIPPPRKLRSVEHLLCRPWRGALGGPSHGRGGGRGGRGWARGGRGGARGGRGGRCSRRWRISW